MSSTPLVSALCTEASILSDGLVRWADRLRPVWDTAGTGIPAPMHRKVWEWTYIVEALHQRGVLRPGARGLGFGVGRDPLAALFADLGCTVVATDAAPEAARDGGWVATGQYAGDVEGLNDHGICDPDAFAERVSFRTVDMNRIPADLREFDFTWSACAFEHLGSIALGQDFMLRQMRCLRAGGVGAHSTEFNVFSDHATITRGETVLFRRCDIDWLARELRAEGHHLVVDFDAGSGATDRIVAVPPWSGPHLKLQVGEHVSTSMVVVVDKGAGPGQTGWKLPVLRGVRHRLALDLPVAVPLVDGAAARLRAIRRRRRLTGSPG